MSHLRFLEQTSLLTTEAAPSGHPGSATALACSGDLSTVPTSPWEPAASSTPAKRVVPAPGYELETENEANAEDLRRTLLRVVAEAEPGELPALVGALAHAQAVALARLTTPTREGRASADDRLVAAEQAALLTSLHPETIRDRGRRGLLPTVRYGKSVRFLKSDLMRGGGK